jgi:3'-phosphoadenosine 5'-phosphosulfate sulfotransferase (PAPS reductase)/FAD synthetase
MADPNTWRTARVHSLTRAFRRRVAETRDAAAEFVAEHGTTMVCWSGGKDSTAAALVAEHVDGVHVARFDAGLSFPGVDTYVEQVGDGRGWWWANYQTGSALDVLVANGSWDHDAESAPDNGAWWETTMAGPRGAAVAAANAKAMMWGLRSDESMRRRMLLSRGRGRFTDSQLRMPVFCPIWQWSTIDVWAAHWVFDCPRCPVYDRLDEIGCPPDAQRLDVMVGSDGRHTGRFVWLKRGWPDEWAELVVRPAHAGMTPQPAGHPTHRAASAPHTRG